METKRDHKNYIELGFTEFQERLIRYFVQEEERSIIANISLNWKLMLCFCRSNFHLFLKTRKMWIQWTQATKYTKTLRIENCEILVLLSVSLNYRGLTRHRWTDYMRALQAYISTGHSDSMAAAALLAHWFINTNSFWVNSLTGDSVTLGKVFYPCVVKASKGEDSKGVRLAKDQQSFLAALEHALSFSDQVIVERCVYFSVL